MTHGKEARGLAVVVLFALAGCVGAEPSSERTQARASVDEWEPEPEFEPEPEPEPCTETRDAGPCFPDGRFGAGARGTIFCSAAGVLVDGACTDLGPESCECIVESNECSRQGGSGAWGDECWTEPRWAGPCSPDGSFGADQRGTIWCQARGAWDCFACNAGDGTEVCECVLDSTACSRAGGSGTAGDECWTTIEHGPCEREDGSEGTTLCDARGTWDCLQCNDAQEVDCRCQ